MANKAKVHRLEDAYRVVMARSRQNLCTGCMEWTGTASRQGYGAVQKDKKMHKAHRVTWEFKNGPIPDGMQVLHACDNPSCVEVGHLFLGTNLDNVRDKVEKGRSAKKLNKSSVLEIKRMLRSAAKQYEISAMFGVCPSTISRIASGLRWSHVQATEG